MKLGVSQVSGTFIIPATDPWVPVARLPEDAEGPAYLTAVNNSPGSVIYLRWIPLKQTGNLNGAVAQAPIALSYSLAYTWPNPPRDAMLVAKATVADSALGVDGQWNVPQEARI